jgi:hypothetical protein
VYVAGIEWSMFIGGTQTGFGVAVFERHDKLLATSEASRMLVRKAGSPTENLQETYVSQLQRNYSEHVTGRGRDRPMAMETHLEIVLWRSFIDQYATPSNARV